MANRPVNVREAIAQLETLLTDNLDVPHVRGRINKAEICRRLGIARSTANANPRIRALLALIEKRPRESEAIHDYATLEQTAALESGTLAADEERKREREALAMAHLLATGRLIR
ncbi:hypothetical protein PQR46_20430 [Paraburkholderia sediminicola]|uniref:hypothetical protein n=1 Tax=Paraburkholderia sediminicola TaxID=458836 RepID=UPI0038BC7655